MNRVAAIAAVLAAVVVSAILVETAPSQARAQHAAFPVGLELGERGDGRNLAGRLDDPRLADTVLSGDWRGSTTGQWLVIDATASTRGTGARVSASLVIGELTYLSVDRSGVDPLDSVQLEPGLPWSGVLLFELPADAATLPGADRAVLRVGTALEPRLDSVLELPLDLTALPHESRVLVPPAERTTW